MNQRIIELLADSFGKIIIPGLTMTIPLTLISFSFALLIAIFTALVQYSHVKILKEIARFYI